MTKLVRCANRPLNRRPTNGRRSTPRSNAIRRRAMPIAKSSRAFASANGNHPGTIICTGPTAPGRCCRLKRAPPTGNGALKAINTLTRRDRPAANEPIHRHSDHQEGFRIRRRRDRVLRDAVQIKQRRSAPGAIVRDQAWDTSSDGEERAKPDFDEPTSGKAGSAGAAYRRACARSRSS